MVQIDLTEFKVSTSEGEEIIVFSQEMGKKPLTFNLLNLQNLFGLLGTVPLPTGSYDTLTLLFRNLMVLDKQGYPLTINGEQAGMAKVVLSSPIAIFDQNQYIEIDFDLNNSVDNLISGPQGSLTFSPTLWVNSDPPITDPILDGFNGLVETVEDRLIFITFNNETLNIFITDDTVIEVDDKIGKPKDVNLDLQSLIRPGDIIRVYGTLQVVSNTVTASYIENKNKNRGLESQGVVTGVGDQSFSLFVLSSRNSGFQLGSTQTIQFDPDSFFFYTNPGESALHKQLAVGQDVLVVGSEENPNFANKVKLRETKLKGRVVNIDQSSNKVQLIVTTTEGVAIDKIPNFTNPLWVEFDGNFPAGVQLGDELKIEGQFNLRTMGVFTALNCEIIIDDPEDYSGNEQTWVGKDFYIISNSPLKISLTRGNGRGNINNRNVTVLVNDSTNTIEKDWNLSTEISNSQLIQGINSKKYKKMKAQGLYNKSDKTLDAKKIIMEVKKK